MSKEEKLEIELLDCINELCWHCGNYKHDYDGCCDNCRWYKIKWGQEETDE